MQYFEIAFNVLIVVFFAYFFAQNTMRFDFRSSIKKNEKWIKENPNFLLKITPKSEAIDLVVAVGLTALYLVFTFAGVVNIEQDKLSSIFRVLAIVYFFYRTTTYSKSLKGLMTEVPPKENRVALLEARTLSRYLPTWMIYLLITLAALSIIALVGKSFYLGKVLYGAPIFAAFYLGILWACKQLLRERAQGDLERFEMFRNFSIYYVAIALLVVTIEAFAVALNGILYEVDNQVIFEAATMVLMAIVLTATIFDLEKRFVDYFMSRK